MVKLYLASLVLGLVGCINHDTAAVIDQRNAPAVGQSLAGELEDGAHGFGTVDQGLAAGVACVTLTGDSTDPDLDSIPNGATLNFNCTEASLDLTSRMTGTEMVTDDQPTTVAWAFSATANLHVSIISVGGASVTSDRVGTIVATQGSAIGPFSLARTLDVTTVLQPRVGANTTVTMTNAWTATFTPQATWTPGGAIVTGSLTATGAWMAEVSTGGIADATLATPTPLTITPSCAARITAGTVIASFDNHGHASTITVVWTGCGVSTVTYAAN